MDCLGEFSFLHSFNHIMVKKGSLWVHDIKLADCSIKDRTYSISISDETSRFRLSLIFPLSKLNFWLLSKAHIERTGRSVKEINDLPLLEALNGLDCFTLLNLTSVS